MSILDLFRSKKVPESEHSGPAIIEPKDTTTQSAEAYVLGFGPQPAPVLDLGPHYPDRPNTIPPEKYKTSMAVQATSMARFMDQTFDPYRFSRFRDLYKYNEPSFYRDYRESRMQNPWTAMCLEFVVREIFANGAHFEGAGATPVTDFFWKDGTWDKLRMMVSDGFTFGNGFMDFGSKAGKLVRTRVLIPDYVQVKFDLKTGDREYWDMIGAKKLREEFLGHFMPKELNGTAYGMSLLRPNYVFLQALLDTSGDVVAAIKRTGYAPIVIRLDLEGLKDEDKLKAMSNYKATLQEVQSASNNFIMDKRHEAQLLGQGGAGARLLPTNDMLEPIIAVVLFNFGVPLGLFLQTGANKAIIEEQRKAMQRFYEEMRTKIKDFVEKKIIPRITNRSCTLVFNKPPVTTEETQKAMEIHSKLFELGMISREYFLNYWDISDEGTTFYEPPEKPMMNNGGGSNGD